MISVQLPQNPGIRLIFSTEDHKELTAHLDTLDALQIQRPADVTIPVEPPVMWCTELCGVSGASYRVRFFTSPTHVEYQLEALKSSYGQYYGETLRAEYLRKE